MDWLGFLRHYHYHLQGGLRVSLTSCRLMRTQLSSPVLLPTECAVFDISPDDDIYCQLFHMHVNFRAVYSELVKKVCCKES